MADAVAFDDFISPTTAEVSTTLAATFMDAWQNDPRAIWSSFSMIVVSEIGDKTFLIAAILAMRQSRTTVFAGAFAALALMSVLSAFMGVVLPTLLPRSVTTLMAAVLFFVFGVKMLLDAMKMTGDEMGEEWEEAKREVEQEADEGDRMELHNMEQGLSNGNGHHHRSPSAASPKGAGQFASIFSTAGFKEGTRNLCGLCFSPIFAHAFILTFLGEWGDRSQIATIALAAAHNIWLVAFGTIAGHCLCTGMAVLGGRWIATRISVKHVTLGGACMFLLFGILYTFESFTEARSAGAGAASLMNGFGVGGKDVPRDPIEAAAAMAIKADLDGLPSKPLGAPDVPGQGALNEALRRAFKGRR